MVELNSMGFALVSFSKKTRAPRMIASDLFTLAKNRQLWDREGESFRKRKSFDKSWGSVAFFSFVSSVLRPRAVARGRARFRCELDAIKA